MAQFFIRRPVLAWVISIFIVIAGLLALPQIPVAQYPQVAWPQITISTSYTGAGPAEINQAVAQPIEDELNGVEGLAYYESVSDSSGSMQITATFEPGTDIARAQVDVQNAVSRVQPLLPQSVVPHLQRARALERMEKFAEAEAAYREGLKVGPNDPRLANNLAYLLANRRLRLDDVARTEPANANVRGQVGDGLFQHAGHARALSIDDADRQ